MLFLVCAVAGVLLTYRWKPKSIYFDRLYLDERVREIDLRTVQEEREDLGRDVGEGDAVKVVIAERDPSSSIDTTRRLSWTVERESESTWSM